MIKYSEGVNPGHLILSEQKLVHRGILCITSGRPQAPWALQIPQIKSSWPGSERKERQAFHRAHSDLWSHHSHTVRGTVDAQLAGPAARLPDELQGQPCPGDSCFLPADGHFEKAPRRSRKSEGESNSEERPGSTRELKRQEARLRSRKDPFPAVLIRDLAEAVLLSARASLCLQALPVCLTVRGHCLSKGRSFLSTIHCLFLALSPIIQHYMLLVLLAANISVKGDLSRVQNSSGL